MDTLMQETKAQMEKCLDALANNFLKVRTGRANANNLADITVDYYGVPTPITQVAAVKTPEAHMLIVEPWDKSSLGAIEKAIQTSDLGITPNNDGNVIRLPFPAPTEERRKELVKECAQIAEDARISVRNTRRDTNNKLERMAKDNEISEDDVHRSKERVQKLTDEFIEKIDEALNHKEAEVMEI